VERHFPTVLHNTSKGKPLIVIAHPIYEEEIKDYFFHHVIASPLLRHDCSHCLRCRLTSASTPPPCGLMDGSDSVLEITFTYSKILWISCLLGALCWQCDVAEWKPNYRADIVKFPENKIILYTRAKGRYFKISLSLSFVLV